MQNTDFAFEFSEEAASQNSRLLQRHGYDLARALQQQQHSPLAPGSEFKAVPILHHLCHGHPLWQRLQQYLSDGVDYSRATITDDVRLSNLTSAIKRGNHKSAPQPPYCDLKGQPRQILSPPPCNTIPGREGSVDVFLDDSITLGLLRSPTADRLAYAVPVIIDTFARPLTFGTTPQVHTHILEEAHCRGPPIRTTDSPRLAHQHQVPDDISSILSPTKHQDKTTIGPTPQLTSMEKFFSFYNANGEHIQIHTDNEIHTLPPYPFI